MKSRLVCGLSVCLIGFVGLQTGLANDGMPSVSVMGQDWSTYGKSLSGPVERQGATYGMHPKPTYFNPHLERTATWWGHYTTPGRSPYGETPYAKAGYGPAGYCPPGYGPPGYGPYGYCPHGVPCQDCPQCWAAKDWRPTHHNYFSYSEPTGLVYPPANQPPAVVQYPYYTVKGPDDFFLDRDGARGVAY